MVYLNNKLRTLIILFFLLLFMACSPQHVSVPEGKINQELPAKTRTLLDEFSQQQGNVGVLVRKEKGGVVYEYATGYATKAQQLARTKDLFQIGSASKMFTAIAIQQLIEQGHFSLNTPVQQFFLNKPTYSSLSNFKGNNYWGNVTVEMLLNHTSGTIDYLNVYGDDDKALEVYGIRGKEFSSDELISLAINFGDANFVPGEKWSYSNTGYILLGEIISKVSGLDWRDYVQSNIFDAANMTDTWFGTRIPESASNREMSSYYKGAVSYMPPSLASSAGEVVSSLEDMAKFIRHWSKGGFYQKPGTLKQQLTQSFMSMGGDSDVFQYGRGIILLGGYFGHSGQTFGFQTYVAISPKSGDIYVIGINDASISSMDLFIELAGITLQ